MGKEKYTQDVLQNLVSQSKSITDVLRRLGLKEAGGTHSHIKRKVREFGIDISHFELNRNANCGPDHKGGSRKLEWKEVLVKRDSGNRQKAFRLRRALIESGRAYQCEKCGQGNEWFEKTLRLEVNHKDNDWLNDSENNLQFLCPNCHSQELHDGNHGLMDETSNARYERQRRSMKKSTPE